MKKTLFLILMIIISFVLINPVFAQIDTIFTPFVSRIKVDSTKTSIKISWKDTGDIEGNCIIYRHTSAITADNIDEAVKIARLPQGVEYYEDFPPYTNTNYFYAVFMEDTDSLLHEVFIPFRNLTSNASFITEKTKDNTPALITAIKAWAGKDSVQISFKCSKPSAELFIYRNTEAIEDKDDILAANLIATLPGTSASFTDYPVPGIGYYYGIIDSNLIKTGSYIFKAGENITIVPIELKLSSSERIGLPKVSTSRPKPLPYLSISRGYQSGRHLSPSIIDSLPDFTEISATTSTAVENLIAGTKGNSERDLVPIILKQDKYANSGSEHEMLSDILVNDFIEEEFEAARVKLLDFQKIKRTGEIEASVHFYLGQIYYFMGDYRTSFTEFLFAEEFYYMAARPWIDNIFKRLRL